jgi:hypothetical protein
MVGSDDTQSYQLCACFCIPLQSSVAQVSQPKALVANEDYDMDIIINIHVKRITDDGGIYECTAQQNCGRGQSMGLFTIVCV